MTNSEFIHWINGYTKLSDDKLLNRRQYTIIKHHTELVQAVVNQLEENVYQFMRQLDAAFKQTDTITISEFKKMLVNFSE